MVFDEAFRPRELLLAEEPLGGLPARSRTGGGPEPAILCRDNLLRSVACLVTRVARTCSSHASADVKRVGRRAIAP